MNRLTDIQDIWIYLELVQEHPRSVLKRFQKDIASRTKDINYLSQWLHTDGQSTENFMINSVHFFFSVALQTLEVEQIFYLKIPLIIHWECAFHQIFDIIQKSFHFIKCIPLYFSFDYKQLALKKGTVLFVQIGCLIFKINSVFLSSILSKPKQNLS